MKTTLLTDVTVGDICEGFVYIKTIFELNKRHGWSKKRFAPFGTVCYNSRCEK